MMSDYELLVIEEIRRGERDAERIARKTGIAEVIVRKVMERLEDAEIPERTDERRIEFSRDSLSMLLNVLIIWLVIELLRVIVT